MNRMLNMCVLDTGTIAVWQGDDVDNGWALTAAEAREIADDCDRTVARGEDRVCIGHDEAASIHFRGHGEDIARLGAAMRQAADRAEAKTATKQ